MRALLIVCLFALAGCTTASILTAPNGRQGYSIACNGNWNSTASCYRKAGEVCPTGYDVLDGGTETRGMILSTGTGFVGGTTAKRHLIISCKT